MYVCREVLNVSVYQLAGQDVDELYSALPSLCLSPRCPASHLVYGPFLAAALHRNPRHQRQQLVWILAIHALSGQLETLQWRGR